MAYKMLQVALCSTVLIGALGAPFLLEDPSNQFLHLKRHIYFQDYWNPDHSLNTWRNTLADQAHETWTALKTTAQYYLNVNTFTLDTSTAQ
uniref:Chromosome 3 open reading frame 85 n=1 Tax=Balaenoptera musculus TaxID=9771 RepID=A0A8C0C9A9_BALMU